MKRITVISVLIIFIAGTFGASFAFAAKTDDSTTDDVKTIGIIQYISHPSLDNCYAGVEEALKEKYNPDKIGTFKIGSCIGSHSGPGVLGILSFKK